MAFSVSPSYEFNPSISRKRGLPPLDLPPLEEVAENEYRFEMATKAQKIPKVTLGKFFVHYVCSIKEPVIVKQQASKMSDIFQT